jgi:hypothetical protein
MIAVSASNIPVGGKLEGGGGAHTVAKQEDGEHRLLIENTALLLQREHELVAIRVREEQLRHWLKLAQDLPQVFADYRLPVESLLGRVRRLLIDGLRLQRMMFFDVEGTSLRPLAPDGPERILDNATASLLATLPSGMCNDGDTPCMATMAMHFGLYRFMWARMLIPGRPALLMAAGYDRDKAPFQHLFDENSVAHFSNAAQHVQSLLGNALLLAQLESQRDHLHDVNQALHRRERELQAATEQLQAANDRLEQRVLERTQELTTRNRDMRLLLDNVNQALLTIDSDGRLAKERSVMADYWFGSYTGQPSFVEYIGKTDEAFAKKFESGMKAMREGLLPRKMCLAQLPENLQGSEREFHCTYMPLTIDESDFGLLIVIDDVTDEIRHVREGAEREEMLALLQGMVWDSERHHGFALELQEILNRVSPDVMDAATSSLLRRLGSIAARAGASVMADLCQRADVALARQDHPVFAQILERLRERWAVITSLLQSYPAPQD